jgi:hypothetical protein
MIDGKKQLLGLICSVFISLVFLSFKYDGLKTDFGDAAAMGAATKSLFAVRGEFPIHCQSDEELNLCVNGVLNRNPQRKALWLGNSQLHAVNQLQKDERNAPDLLAERLASRSIDLVTVSIDNANMQEHLVLFHYLLDRMQPDMLILPVVFDDTREDGLRDSVVKLTQKDWVARRLEENDIGRKLLKKSSTSTPLPTSEATPQERSEASLNVWLDENIRLWRARSEMRGDFFIYLYKLRNKFFGITPSSKRKIIPGPYTNNMGAFEAVLQTAAASGVRVLVYVAPIGSNRGERPYVQSEYQRFKDDIAVLAMRYGANLENFEDLIPELLWGHKDSTTTDRSLELDFMHFTAAGHLVLAEKIDKKIFTIKASEVERGQ